MTISKMYGTAVTLFYSMDGSSLTVGDGAARLVEREKPKGGPMGTGKSLYEQGRGCGRTATSGGRSGDTNVLWWITTAQIALPICVVFHIMCGLVPAFAGQKPRRFFRWGALGCLDWPR